MRSRRSWTPSSPRRKSAPRLEPSNPFIGATRPRLGADRFRFLLLIGYPYVVVYTADTDPPRVLRVLHSSRDLPRILAGLDP